MASDKQRRALDALTRQGQAWGDYDFTWRQRVRRRWWRMWYGLTCSVRGHLRDETAVDSEWCQRCEKRIGGRHG